MKPEEPVTSIRSVIYRPINPYLPVSSIGINLSTYDRVPTQSDHAPPSAITQNEHLFKHYSRVRSGGDKSTATICLAAAAGENMSRPNCLPFSDMRVRSLS
jgi:hypothetical protein